MYIEMNHVTLNIGNANVLNDICLRFEQGRCYGITGRNGSGKTMLFRVLCGFWEPTSGEVIVDGKTVGKKNGYIKEAGAIIGETDFISGLTGFQNLKMLAEIRKEIQTEQIYDVLKLVGLYEERNKKYKKYSLGMKQRLRIAQAVMENPKILILDEPFNGLDKEGVVDMRNLLHEKKKQGITILMASHNESDIGELCDETFELEKGSVVDEEKKC